MRLFCVRERIILFHSQRSQEECKNLCLVNEGTVPEFLAVIKNLGVLSVHKILKAVVFFVLKAFSVTCVKGVFRYMC